MKKIVSMLLIAIIVLTSTENVVYATEMIKQNEYVAEEQLVNENNAEFELSFNEEISHSEKENEQEQEKAEEITEDGDLEWIDDSEVVEEKSLDFIEEDRIDVFEETSLSAYSDSFEKDNFEYLIISSEEGAETVKVSGGFEITGDIEIPAYVTYEGVEYTVIGICDEAFKNREDFVGQLILPNTILEIGDSAFWGCENLKGDLVIPEGVQKICDDAFWNCSGFDGKIVLPNSLNYVGDSAFENCSGLQGTLEIPSSLSFIAENAFAFDCGLKEIKLHNGITDIGGSAFEYCDGLVNVTIDCDNVIINEYAFANCINLRKVQLGDGVKLRGDAIFHFLENYKDIPVRLDLVIFGNEGSEAAQYATNNGFTFCTNDKLSEDIYKVSFDANGGNIEQASKMVVNSTLFGLLPVATRTGYIFEGWYWNDKEIQAETAVELIENIVLTAQWTEDKSAKADENEPNNSFETAMPIQTDVVYKASIGNKDTEDYFSINLDGQFANRIYIENIEALTGGVIKIYNSQKRIEEVIFTSSCKYDAENQSYYYLFCPDKEDTYYLVISYSRTKTVDYCVRIKSNKKDTSLEQEIKYENDNEDRYRKIYTAPIDTVYQLKNYLIKNGEYEYDKELNWKTYTVSCAGSYDDYYVDEMCLNIWGDGTTDISFITTVRNNEKKTYPYQYLSFSFDFDKSGVLDTYGLYFSYNVGNIRYSTKLRAGFDISQKELHKFKPEFKYFTKNYSDEDNETLRNMPVKTYQHAILYWEDMLAEAFNVAEMEFSDLLLSNNLPPNEDDIETNGGHSINDNVSIAFSNPKKTKYTYTGYDIMPAVKVTYLPTKTVLKENQDYILKYYNNVEAGTAEVYVQGVGEYKDVSQKPLSFSIVPKSVSGLKCDTMPNFVYNYLVEDDICEALHITDGNREIGEDEYTISFKIGREFVEYIPDEIDSKGVKVSLYITGKENNYLGTKKIATFTVYSEDTVKKDISKCTAVVKNGKYVYSGKAIKPKIVVYGENGKILSSKNYKVVYRQNINAGIGYASVYGTGSYTGLISDLEFNIEKKDINKCKLTVKNTNMYYNGKAQKDLMIIVKNGNEVLTEGVDYEVLYEGDFTNLTTKYNKHTVTIKALESSRNFQNGLGKKLTKTFTIKKARLNSKASITTRLYYDEQLVNMDSAGYYILPAKFDVSKLSFRIYYNGTMLCGTAYTSKANITDITSYSYKLPSVASVSKANKKITITAKGYNNYCNSAKIKIRTI